MKNFPQKIITLSDSGLQDQNIFKLMAEEFINQYNLWKLEEANNSGKAIFICNNKEIAYKFYKNVVDLLTLGENSSRSFSTQNPQEDSLSSHNYSESFTSNFGFPEEWHYGKLPHRNKTGLIQFITFRLADSLPQELLRQIEEELTYLTDQVGDLQKRKKYEKWLDRGYGCCALNNPEMAIIMQNALQHHDGIKYNLLAWCIMPNHVHVLIKANNDLSRIIQSWKSFTGRWALANNERLRLGFPKEIKQFWWAESWDRFIRDEDHFNNTIRYIMSNPKKAHLPEDFEAYRCMGCNIDVEEKENGKWEGKRLKLELQPAQLRVLNGMNDIQEFNDESSNLKVAIVVNEDFSNLKLLTPALIIKYEGAG